MKAKNISKRVLSVILCTVMLFSCWVFTAPTASVSSAAAGNYYYRVTYKFPHTNNLNGTYKGWNSSGSFQGSDDSWGISFRYKGDNGKASSYSYANVQPSVTGSQTTYSGTLSGFPDRMLVTLDDNCSWYPFGTPCKLEVYKLEIGSSASNLKTVWTGTVHLESWTGEYSVYVDIDGNTGWVKGSSGGDEYVNNSNSSSWTWPKVNSMDDPTGDATVYVNTNGATSNTYTYTAGAVKDDYGVRWYQDATLASNSMQNGVSFSSPTLTVPGSANRAANYNVSIKQTFSGLTQKTKTITVSVFKYNVTFYSDSSKSTIWKVNNKDTNAYDYNAAITLPHATGWLNTDKSTASNHYTISNYYENDSTAIPSGNKLTSGAQTRGFYPKYTETAHSFVYDSSVAITDTQHQVKCSTSGCGYTKKVNHTYNQDTVRDATTQVTAPTCTTAGTYKKTCVCGKVDPTNNSVYTPTSGTGTALSHAWTAAEYDGVTSLKTAADCLNNAIYYKVCSRCHQVHTTDTWVKTGTALGHSFPNTWDPFTGNENPHGTTYNGDEYHKHTCNYASCPGDTVQDKNGKWQTDYDNHSWIMEDGDIKWTDTGDGKQCYKECSLCHKKVYANHTYTKTTVDPTCTEQGYDLHICSSCGYEYKDNYKVASGHDVEGVAYQSDRSNHWKVCKTCSKNVHLVNNEWVEGTSGHSLNEGEVTTPPTCTETGIKTFTCTVCGNTNNTTTVDALGHNYTVNNVRDATTLKKAATCTENGEYWYTCSRCGDVSDSLFYEVETKGEIGYKLGHHWARWKGCSEEKISELSGAVPVVFKCQNGCENYCAAQYNPETKEYEEDPGHSGDSPTSYEVASNTAQIPTPSFNEHFEHFDGQVEPYQYSDRKASLRVRPSEKGEPTQAMRFSGNLSAGNIVAAGVQFNVNPNLIYDNNELMSLSDIRTKNLSDKAKKAQGETVADAFPDDTIIDFGFVFTQARFIRTAKTEINYDLMTLDNIGTNYRIYRMSVVGNNLANYNQSKTIENWKGLTMIGEEATFNLVIDVNEKNYQATYCARTYVIYKYHGDIICVYDQPYENYKWDDEKGKDVPIYYYSHDSVYNQAHKVLTLTEPTDFVKSYLEDKIINNTATQNFNDSKGDKKVDYTLKDFPKQEEY